MNVQPSKMFCPGVYNSFFVYVVTCLNVPAFAEFTWLSV